jgi:hypothetical protein
LDIKGSLKDGAEAFQVIALKSSAHHQAVQIRIDQHDLIAVVAIELRDDIRQRLFREAEPTVRPGNLPCERQNQLTPCPDVPTRTHKHTVIPSATPHRSVDLNYYHTDTQCRIEDLAFTQNILDNPSTQLV